MLPVFFHIFGIPIHSYGLMLAVSFLAGIWLASVRAKNAGLKPEIIADVAFWVIVSAIVGARLYYVLLKPAEFSGRLLNIANPFQDGGVGIGGLVMYGGFIGAVVAAFIFFRLKRLPFLPYADAMAPSLGIGIFFTRIGCFLNGCCYGAPGQRNPQTERAASVRRGRVGCPRSLSTAPTVIEIPTIVTKIPIATFSTARFTRLAANAPTHAAAKRHAAMMAPA